MTRAPRSIAALIVAIAATCTLVAGATSPAAAAPSPTEKSVVSLTNAERSQRGLVTLRTGACLQRYADRWAASLARRQVMEHQDIGRVLRACKLSRVGENVAVGYPSARAVVREGWMRSSGHRANILNRQYRKIGVGVARGSDGRLYYAQVFGTK